LAAVPTEWKTFAFVALKTGLRVGELLALKWEDLDLAAGRLMVRRTLWHTQEVMPKGGKVREVPLGNEVIMALKARSPPPAWSRRGAGRCRNKKPPAEAGG